MNDNHKAFNFALSVPLMRPDKRTFVKRCNSNLKISNGYELKINVALKIKNV